VTVDLEDLPPVPDPQTALEGGSLLFPEAGTNVCVQSPAEGVGESRWSTR
jgi:hypothetical protein